MTTIYFVRHAEPDKDKFNADQFNCPLSEKGKKDAQALINLFSDKEIHKVFSSPYRRAIDTVKPFADKNDFEVELDKDFSEWEIGRDWMYSYEEYRGFIKRHWDDFSHQEGRSERLGEIQEKNISALNKILKQHPGKNIIIGSHGMALSLVINHFDKAFGMEEFLSISNRWPWLVRMDFAIDGKFIGWNEMSDIDLSL